MRIGGDVGIDSHGEARRLAQMGRARRSISNSLALSTLNSRMPGCKSLVDLARQLADAGEDDLTGRFSRHRLNAMQLAAGNDVESRAQPRSSRRIDRFEFAFTE